MALGEIPDTGLHHPEAAGGAAFNGRVGVGIANLLVNIIRAQPGVKTICDLGCGNGHLAGRLGALGYTVLGVDAGDTYLAIARAHNSGANTAFLKATIDADLQSKLAGHAPFDLVVSSDVIEHLYDPLALLKAASAILRPGGIGVVGTPYHGYLKNVAISVLDKWDEHHGVHWHGGHIKFFSPRSLSYLLAEAGFAKPDFHYYGRIPGLWKNMIAVAKRR